MNESSAKDKDIEILKKKVIVETNELSRINGEIDLVKKKNIEQT
jgi:hypothetical protein